MPNTAITLACRPELLLSPLPAEGRYAARVLDNPDCYTLGAEEYFLLARLDGRQSAAALCRAFEEHFGQELPEEELHEFIASAQTRGFLAPSAVEPTSHEGQADSGAPTSTFGYDEVPYVSRPFPQTHPNNLATVATLFGMTPPNIERCRVLELGCASGGNLLPMAMSLPNSHFVGIDLSGRQISDGLRTVQALGLRNIELRQLSILDVHIDFGQFDYILCHGVYSWVSALVQDRILEICSWNLAPNGVAYVSYNTNPGWHLPGVVRAMMRYHAGGFSESSVRVRQARAALEFLAGAVGQNDGYGGALQKELHLLRGVPDHYLFHEYLAEVNTPVYFHEFNARAERWGLQYLGEAAFAEMLTEYFAPDVEKTLRLLSQDLVQAEQYMDFLRNRRFRQTLLCHQGASLNRNLGLERLERLHVSSAFRPVCENPDIHSCAPQEFTTPRGLPLTTGEPLVKAALLHLAAAWPAAVPFADLPAAALARLGRSHSAADDTHTRALLSSLLKCAGPYAIEFSVNAPSLVAGVSPCPMATPLARHEAQTTDAVTNQRHQTVPLSAFDRQVLRLLDGTRNCAQLVQSLPSSDAALGDLLEQSLSRLLRHSLLVG